MPLTVRGTRVREDGSPTSVRLYDFEIAAWIPKWAPPGSRNRVRDDS